MLIIPAIDIIDGKVVRLTKGDYSQSKFYSNSPIEQAKIYAENGFTRIHIVDLHGAKSGFVSVDNILTNIKKNTNLEVEFGGGIRSFKDAIKLTDLGVDYLIIGSLSILNRDEFEKIVKAIGGNKIISGSDVDGENILIKGWTEDTNISIYDHIKYCSDLEINDFLCTDIAKDGVLAGPNVGLYKNLVNKYPNKNIYASGGVSNMQDIINLLEVNAFAAIVGKAIYENKIELKELSEIGK